MASRLVSVSNLQAKLASGKLSIADFQVKEAENWSICGASGSGKTALVNLLSGELKHQKGEIQRPSSVFVISQNTFDSYLQEERKLDESDLTDAFTQGRSIREYLTHFCGDDSWQTSLADWLDVLNMNYRLDTGICALSTGESRKLLWLMAILFDGVLIFDDAFSGVDVETVSQLNRLLSILYQTHTHPVIWVSSRAQSLPDNITHILYLDNQQSLFAGTLDKAKQHPKLTAFFTPQVQKRPLPESKNAAFNQGDSLVKLKDVCIRYDKRCLFSGLDWEIKAGEHWLLQGPNGCGKTSLLELITGDNQQVYANYVETFGMRRGQGESIWQVKKHIGFVSGHLHEQYRIHTNLLTVLLSGFFDSIGLYQKESVKQRQIALNWLDILGLKAQKGKPFKQLGYGQQRQLLIARALIKQPALLILDEPTNGLDEAARLQLKDFITQICTLKHTSLLLVSHEANEFDSLFEHKLIYNTNVQQFEVINEPRRELSPELR